MKLIKRAFAWWDGATLGTQFTLLVRGARKVGEDEYGNRYFEERKAHFDGKKRRYVVFKGYADPSRVPAEWHGWLHHTWEEPPTVEPPRRQAWELDHKPNLTGTVHAYRPPGSLAEGGQRPLSHHDYEAWSPDAPAEGDPKNA